MLYYDESICGMDLDGNGRGDYNDDFIWNESMKNMFGEESEADSSYDSSYDSSDDSSDGDYDD